VSNQEILDNAPEGATHVEILTDYKKIYYYKRTYKDFCNKYMYDVYQQSTWYPSNDISGDFRSLVDIRRIVELERIVECVAHIGVDFGYGVYEIDQATIDKARQLTI
jgi:hypothetical protein